jgi:hypothetical protein
MFVMLGSSMGTKGYGIMYKVFRIRSLSHILQHILHGVNKYAWPKFILNTKNKKTKKEYWKESKYEYLSDTLTDTCVNNYLVNRIKQKWKGKAWLHKLLLCFSLNSSSHFSVILNTYCYCNANLQVSLKSWTFSKILIVLMWLRHYAASRNIAGLSPDELIKFFHLTFQPHCSPGVDSASNINEYEKLFLECREGQCVGLTISPPSIARLSRQFCILNIWRPFTLSRPVTEIDGYTLLFTNFSVCGGG